MYIPIEGFWSYVQTRVGTPHNILRCLRNRAGGHRTFHLRVSGQMFKQVGTPHIKKSKNTSAAGGFYIGTIMPLRHSVAPSCKLELARFSA